MTRIAILGEYNPNFPPHPATDAAILHSAAKIEARVKGEWISTEAIDLETIGEYSGLWISPGSPYKNLKKTLEAIRYGREQGIPCLGTCGGFQHIVIEYARNILGYSDAQHAEYDPDSSNLFISSLSCSLAGREMNLRIVPGSKVAEFYGAVDVRESYYCNFGVNPQVIPLLRKGPMQIVGSDSEGEIRVLELPGHPFFVATLYVPQNRSTPEVPHPLVTAFLEASVARNSQKSELLCEKGA